jgi:hypothetical protein
LVALQTAHHGSTSPEIRFNTTESGFAAYLNRLLQQNPPKSEVVPLFNRLIDRRGKRGAPKNLALQPRASAQHPLQEPTAQEEQIPCGHRPRMQRAYALSKRVDCLRARDLWAANALTPARRPPMLKFNVAHGAE